MEETHIRYGEDGWVYQGTVKTHRWFQNAYSVQHDRRVRVWEPNLNIVDIERRCKRMMDRKGKFRDEHYRPVFNQLMVVKQAHAKPTHKFTGDIRWWMYKASKHGISFDWVDEPKDKINHELGQLFYELDDRMVRYGGYVYTFEIVLSHLIEKMLRKEYKPERTGTTMKLTINGRLFWYVAVQSRYIVEWKKISWPYDAIDKIIEVEI